jgi:uncharacterized protein (DUF58 family)
MLMEFKENALVVIALSLIVLLMGASTGGIVFFAAVVLTVLLLCYDYNNLVMARKDLLNNIEIKSGLSRDEIYLGASTQLVCRLIYHGSSARRLKVDQPLDDSIKSSGFWKPVEMMPGSIVYLKMTLEPSASGLFEIKPPNITIESWLFKDSFTKGKQIQLAVLLPIGINVERVGPSKLRAKSSMNIFDATVNRKGQGIDFLAIRKYMGGDSIKRVDWVRSSRMNELMVRDYEDDQPLPAFFFIDLDPSMGMEGEHIALHTAISLVTELINKITMNGERIGLVCFSKEGVVHFMPALMGNDHLYNLRSILSRLRTVDEESAIYRHEHETLPYDLRNIFKNGPRVLIDDMLREYAANIEDDGFSRSVKMAIKSVNTPSRLVVITNLSMGMASLLNNLRIAQYYGYKVSVVLMPHTWHEEEGLSSAEAISAANTLKANGVDAVVMEPGEPAGDVIKRSGFTSIKARIRR